MNRNRSLRKDKRAISPAFSTVILTAAGIVMILVVLNYANGSLNSQMAANEFSTNKQFMQTTGLQIDDIAWTIGRTQSISYSTNFGSVKFEILALNYSFQVHTSSGWETLAAPGETGIIMYNMPVGNYALGNNTFERLPQYANNSFLVANSSAPVSQVFCEERVPMHDGSYSRIVVVPTLRMLSSTITSSQISTSYFKFYLPTLENTTTRYYSEALTLTGDGITKITRSGVDQVRINVSFLKATPAGFDSSFFNFKSNSVTLNNTTSPKITPNSVVEFYFGKVAVGIGQP
jgi:hypothetical protein